MTRRPGNPSIATVIPIYQTSLSEEEKSNISRNLKSLTNAHVALVHTQDNQHLINEIIAEASNNNRLFGKRVPRGFLRSIAAYNRLLLSPDFYRLFLDYTHILILQLDALLIGNDIETWLYQGWSYIGAPFFLGLDRPHYPLRFLGGGNGGFSFRNIRDCLHVLSRLVWLYPCLRRYERQSLPGEGFRAEVRALLRSHWWIGPRGTNTTMNEDLFWSFIAPQVSSSFRVAPPSVSMHFAWEMEPEYMLQQCKGHLPLGCHGWQKYNPEFWRNHLGLPTSSRLHQ